MRSACPRRVSRSAGSAPHSASRVERRRVRRAAAVCSPRCLSPCSSRVVGAAVARSRAHGLRMRGCGAASPRRVTATSAAPRRRPASALRCAAPRRRRAARVAASRGRGAAAPAAPRMVHGGPRHLHRSAAHGPRAVKVGWRANVGGAVAAQVTASPDEQHALRRDARRLASSRSRARTARSAGPRPSAIACIVHLWCTTTAPSTSARDAKKLVALSPRARCSGVSRSTARPTRARCFAKDGTIVFAAGSFVHCVAPRR